MSSSAKLEGFKTQGGFVKYNSVVDLKAEIFSEVFRFSQSPGPQTAPADEGSRSIWVDPHSLFGEERLPVPGMRPGQPPATVGLGVGVPPARNRRSEQFRLTVLVQDPRHRNSPFIEQIKKAARGEVDLRFVGRVMASGGQWHQSRCRPLRIGCSVGHGRATAGTLGVFVRMRHSGDICLLSNNHVLALCNHAQRGDPILQPGRHDGGRHLGDVVGKLNEFIPISFAPGAVNFVDCATATVEAAIDMQTLHGVGTLKGVAPIVAEPDMPVHKLGRTTGATCGRVVAIEVDNIKVAFRNGSQVVGGARFDGQIVIEGAGQGAFSKPGDSGSLIITEGLEAMALLFAGSDAGGTNGRKLTFANPMQSVLSEMDADLVIGG